MKKNKIYGLIGYPLGHSFSAGYFNEKFEKENINAEYKLFPLSHIDEITELFVEEDRLSGLNVTIPYKVAVKEYLNNVSEDAAEIGAVNVIKVSHKNGSIELTGYNSDYIGFLESVQPLINPSIKKALILGTGGASKAVEYALKKIGLETKKVSRSRGEDVISYSDLSPEIISEHLLIVNTTPLGMYPVTDCCPDIPYHFLTYSHVLYDLVYNPAVTEFMKRGVERGATVKNGLEMLYRQAEAAWKIWNS